MSEENNEIEKPSVSVNWSHLQKMKVSATFTLTVEEWEKFIQHSEKTGNSIARTIAEAVKPAIENVRQVLKVIKA